MVAVCGAGGAEAVEAVPLVLLDTGAISEMPSRAWPPRGTSSQSVRLLDGIANIINDLHWILTGSS